MKKFQIAIIDDETIQGQTMTHLLNVLAKDLNLTFHLQVFESAEAFLFSLEDFDAYDLLFIDIQMKAMDGMELARKLRQKNYHMPLVFATAYAEFAINGYEVGALDYLLKPINQEKLAKVFSTYLQQAPKEESFLTIQEGTQVSKIPLSSIIFIEAQRNQVRIQTTEQELYVSKSLKTIQEMLKNQFILVHRSYLVNLEHIDALTNAEVVLSNNQRVPLSRRLAKDVQKAFINHYHQR